MNNLVVKEQDKGRKFAALWVEPIPYNRAGYPAVSEEEAYAAELGRLSAKNLRGYSFETSDEDRLRCGGNTRILDDFFVEYCGRYGIETVYVYDGAVFFPFLDAYAIKKGLPDAQKIKDETGGKRIREEAYDIRGGGAGQFYTRKIWLKLRGSRAAGGNSHLRLKSVTFYALRPLMPQYSTLEAAAKAYKIDVINECVAILSILKKFSQFYKEITGDEFFTDKPAGITIGGLAKKIYLSMKYPTEKNALKAYQRDYKRSGYVDLFLRENNLMLGGLLYSSEFGKTERFVYKYDINSLFPHITATAPALGKLIPCDAVQALSNAADEKYAYIVTFKHLTLLKKDGVPAIFSDPFKPLPKDPDDIHFKLVDIQHPFSLFLEFFTALQNFYRVMDFELYPIAYKMRRCKDPAATQYVNMLYEYKRSESAEIWQKTTAKLLLNNLHGKFAQTTLTARKHCVLVDGVPRYVDDENIEDKFEQKHFDFVRGAYIYSLARVRIMNDILNLYPICRRYGYHYFYSDTDSIITNCPQQFAPLKFSDEIGDYKVEKYYHYWRAVKYKTYFGCSVKHIDDVTAAGINKADAYDAADRMLNEYDDSVFKNIYHFFTDFPKKEIKTQILKRLVGGVAYCPTTRKLEDDNADAFADHLEEE